MSRSPDLVRYALNHVTPQYVDGTDAMALVRSQSTTGNAEIKIVFDNLEQYLND